MKTLFENLLNIDNIETDTNTTKYLSAQEFQKLYKRKLSIIEIEKDNPTCITNEYDDSMEGLCAFFRTSVIDLSGVYPESKIKSMKRFAIRCEELGKFRGPDPHKNYSDIETLESFFDRDEKLRSFDLSGIAESAKNIKNINRMFSFCKTISTIDLSNFNFSKLESCNDVFSNCKNVTRIDLGNYKTKVEATGMCWENSNLVEFNAPNMILSGKLIFYNCKSLKNINVKYVDVSNIYYNVFRNCAELENVNIYGLNSESDSNRVSDAVHGLIDLSWAVSLNNKSWDFLFKNLGNGNGSKIKLPDTPKKKNIIKKYELIAKQHKFKLV